MNAGKFMRLLITALALFALVVVLGGKARTGWESPKRIEYYRFIEMVDQKPESSILEVRIEKDKITGETKQGVKFQTHIPEFFRGSDLLQSKLVANHIKFDAQPSHLTDMLQSLVVSVLFPVGLLAVFWFFILRQAQSGGNQAMAFGRSRAKRFNENVPKVRFEDVAGADEAKQELAEVVEFLRNAKKFQALGAKIPKGVLLLGPPGCGKTLLARAIAGEAQVPFFHISGSDFVEMFVGVGASRVRDLFETAKANRPSLIFIDEIDAVGRQRGAGLGGGHDEREQTLNQLLVEMDGFDPNSGVILIAATNRPDVLDPALLRPGRFDRRVVVDHPDAIGRRGILEVHVKGKPLADDVNLDALSRRTPGFSGADLANLVNEAALNAARHEKTSVWMEDFERSIDKVIAGPERRSRIMSDKVKEMVAYHEVGHAIVAHLVPKVDPVHKVSILPRGMALGYTMTLPEEDKYLTSKSELLDTIAYALGGRAAEELVFDEMTTGAENDLNRATDTARRMVCEFGMSEKLGPLTLGRRHGNPFLGRDLMEDRNYSEEVASAIDQEVRRIIDDCYERARNILMANRARMRRVVDVLLEKETIEHDEFARLMAETLPGPTTAPIPAPAGV